MNHRGVTGLEIAGVIFLLGLSARVLCRLTTGEWDCGAKRKANLYSNAAQKYPKLISIGGNSHQSILDEYEKEIDEDMGLGDH